MSLILTKPFPRLWSLEAGRVMVVTDLHGDEEAYRRYRDRFVDLQAAGQVDGLIFTGDLIHSDDAVELDKSLEIVLDVLALQASYGQAVIYLCGNHELPHLYGIGLAKGEKVYTPAFEAALDRSQRRPEVMALFDSLPFYLRTRAGVSLTHAGAPAIIADSTQALKIFEWSHRDLLAQAEQVLAAEDIESLRQGYTKLNQVAYDLLAEYYLAVSGPDDPRYNDLLRGFVVSSYPAFNRLLWPALFTRCEQEYGPADYAIFLEALLQEMSREFTRQQVLVAGHMAIRGGHQIVAERHLRLASAPHARPREAGQYLLFDAVRPIRDVNELLPGLGSVY